jgi:signal transduction histidine kinase
LTAFQEAEQQDSRPAGPDPRLDDLAQIVEAYSAVTERLQGSHERLQGEVVRLRRELTSANAQVQRSRRLSALGEMAAGIAHEIRNPLAAIQLYAGLAVEDLSQVEDDAGDAALDNVRKIASAVRGMSAIVNDVLSFARGMEPERVEVRVSELIDRVLAANAPSIDQHEVDVVRRDLASPGLSLFADAGLVQQALLNLVRNAVDAMAEVAGRRVLTIGASEDEVGVVLTVADTGPGVSDDCIDRIFNPFFTTRSSGTGLGLAIVHRIADAHGGSIAVHRDPQHGGAVFSLSLPAPDRPADQEVSPEGQHASLEAA